MEGTIKPLSAWTYPIRQIESTDFLFFSLVRLSFFSFFSSFSDGGRDGEGGWWGARTLRRFLPKRPKIGIAIVRRIYTSSLWTDWRSTFIVQHLLLMIFLFIRKETEKKKYFLIQNNILITFRQTMSMILFYFFFSFFKNKN